MLFKQINFLFLDFKGNLSIFLFSFFLAIPGFLFLVPGTPSRKKRITKAARIILKRGSNEKLTLMKASAHNERKQERANYRVRSLLITPTYVAAYSHPKRSQLTSLGAEIRLWAIADASKKRMKKNIRAVLACVKLQKKNIRVIS